MDIGSKLNSLRITHDLTYQQLADESGVPVGTVKSILTGPTQSPGFEPVCAMLTAMDESIDMFFASAHGPPPPAKVAEKLSTDHNLLPLREEIRTIAGEAVRDVYQSEIFRNQHTNMQWWRGLAIAETAFIIFMLVWDVTHPHMGYIQYAAAILQGMSCAIRFYA